MHGGVSGGLASWRGSGGRAAAIEREDPEFRQRLQELAGERRRFGYRRLTVMFRREGWLVNPKRVCRIYCEEGLAVRHRARKRLKAAARTPSVRRRRATRCGRWTSRTTTWRAEGSSAH
ncbi:MAG: hypothetical protein DMG21_20975 [Acidobacteria bacterium]|nr:MAG: hypothetical protein DMG21_20975 [Acidobacteriota bacterium]